MSRILINFRNVIELREYEMWTIQAGQKSLCKLKFELNFSMTLSLT